MAELFERLKDIAPLYKKKQDIWKDIYSIMKDLNMSVSKTKEDVAFQLMRYVNDNIEELSCGREHFDKKYINDCIMDLYYIYDLELCDAQIIFVMEEISKM